VAEHLAAALVREGLARRTWTGLHRIRAVSKSATAIAGRRPTVLSHYDSFAVDDSVEALEHIILVDDVVSKGRTLLAAATRVQEALPNARIRAFAMVRTLGLVPDVSRLVDPCRGHIRWKAGDAHRNP
jgi:predicted amidophosphoribosyltransferase